MPKNAENNGAIAGTTPAELVKGLGLLDSTMIVMGSMIGSGIFIVSADIANQVQGPGLLLTVWVVSGVMTLIGALSYGELAAAMPRAGGQYVYLREALGPLWGFLYGWTMLLVIQTATIAAVAIAFAKFTGVMVPWFSATAWIWKFGTFGPWTFWFGSLGPYNRRVEYAESARDRIDCVSDVAEHSGIADRSDRRRTFSRSRRLERWRGWC